MLEHDHFEYILVYSNYLCGTNKFSRPKNRVVLRPDSFWISRSIPRSFLLGSIQLDSCPSPDSRSKVQIVSRSTRFEGGKIGHDSPGGQSPTMVSPIRAPTACGTSLPKPNLDHHHELEPPTPTNVTPGNQWNEKASWASTDTDCLMRLDFCSSEP